MVSFRCPIMCYVSFISWWLGVEYHETKDSLLYFNYYNYIVMLNIRPGNFSKRDFDNVT